MRVTNTMIQKSSKTHINNNKGLVDRFNAQMGTQDKIQRPSQDPVVAIRSLKLGSSLSRIDQYYKKNIPDAQSWMDVTETALLNMKKVIETIYSESTKGENGTNNVDDRAAILKELTGLQSQIYDELNADDGGRTLFTGYMTDKTLTFKNESGSNLRYNITEEFTGDDIMDDYYVTDQVTINYDEANRALEMPQLVGFSRIRLAYTEMDVPSATGTVPVYDPGDPSNVLYNENVYEDKTLTYVDSEGKANKIDVKVVSMKDLAENAASGADVDYPYKVGDRDGRFTETDGVSAVYIPETGEIILNRDVAITLKGARNISFGYTKTGFKASDIRPEMYFDCERVELDSAHENMMSGWVKYSKLANPIQYTVSFNQKLTINTEASDVFSPDMERDVAEMVDALNAQTKAEDNAAKVKTMMEDPVYSSDEAIQKNLRNMLDAANKAVDLCKEKVKKLFGANMTKYQKYQDDLGLAITDLGSRGKRLEVTETRVSSQQATFTDLKTTNDKREVSDVVIDYTAAYTAYQASLQATGKALKTSLLDYI